MCICHGSALMALLWCCESPGLADLSTFPVSAIEYGCFQPWDCLRGFVCGLTLGTRNVGLSFDGRTVEASICRRRHGQLRSWAAMFRGFHRAALVGRRRHRIHCRCHTERHLNIHVLSCKKEFRSRLGAWFLAEGGPSSASQRLQLSEDIHSRRCLQ